MPGTRKPPVRSPIDPQSNRLGYRPRVDSRRSVRIACVAGLRSNDSFDHIHQTLTRQPRQWRRRLARLAKRPLFEIAAMLALGVSLPVAAETLLVEIDVPTPVSDGRCSLIEAIVNANGDRQIHADCRAGDGADRIVLPSTSRQTIDRAVPGQANQGLPSITSPIAIVGNQSTLHVGTAAVDTVFDVAPHGDLTLQAATISGDAGLGTASGAPRINNNGTMRLDNVQILIADNRVSAITNEAGGTLFADGLVLDCPDCDRRYYDVAGNGLVNRGNATLTRSSVRNLTVSNDLMYNAGSLRLAEVAVESNYSLDGSSGLVNSGEVSGTDVTFSSNQVYAGESCGISNREGATLTLERGRIDSNNARYYLADACAFVNLGTARLDDVAFTSNYVSNDGRLEMSGCSVDSGFFSSGDLVLEESTLSGSIGVRITNRAEIRNSTIARNFNNYTFGPSYRYAAVEFAGDVTIEHSTIGGNILGVYVSSDPRFTGVHFNGRVSVSNSVLLGSALRSDYLFGRTPQRVFVNSGELISRNNVIGDSSMTMAEAFYGFSPGPSDIVATSDGTHPTPLERIVDSELVPLSSGREAASARLPRVADNGGPTGTVALVAESPALDAADPEFCAPTDQRGVSRPQGASCDVGAFELAESSAERHFVRCPGDIDGDGTVEVAVVNASGATTIRSVDDTLFGAYGFEGLAPISDVVVRPDTNSNGSVELAVLGRDNQVHVWDPLTQALLLSSSFDGPAPMIDLNSAADTSGDGIPELLALAGDPMRVEVRDGLAGTFTSDFRSEGYVTGRDLSVMEPLNGTDSSVVSVLAENRRSDRADKIVLRDLASGDVVREIWLGRHWQLLEQTYIADLNDNGSREVAVLRRHPDGRVHAQIRDTETGAWLNFVGFPRNYSAEALLSIPDINGNRADELVVFGRSSGGDQQAVVKDSRTGERLRNLSFDRALPAQDFVSCGDIDDNGAVDFALVGQRSDDGRIQVVVTDSRTGARLASLTF